MKFSFFLILVCEAIGTAATPGLLCQPRVIVKMIEEKQMECRFSGETEVLRENLPQRHFYPSQNQYPGFNPGRRGGKPAPGLWRGLVASSFVCVVILPLYLRIYIGGNFSKYLRRAKFLQRS
jgi:hypothetical protein